MKVPFLKENVGLKVLRKHWDSCGKQSIKMRQFFSIISEISKTLFLSSIHIFYYFPNLSRQLNVIKNIGTSL